MVWNRNWLLRITIALVVAGLLTSCGIRRKKYENPITADTQQPDKVLFDKAINDIERGRYEVARLTLNTLINTYDTSEFLAKSKLAIAD
jgi:outer membrane protein assembly factor BamD